MEAVWKKVKSALQKQVANHSFRMWIEPLELKRDKRDNWVVSCPNCFSKKRVQDQYGSMIESELQRILKTSCQLAFRVSNNNGKSKSPSMNPMKRPLPEQQLPEQQLPLPNDSVRPHSGRHLRRDFTFDHFVVGGNNDFAYSASLSLASRKIARQNTLFLLSKTGMGKSHLSQAIGHHVLSEYPSDRVYYITAEDFSNEMVYAFRHDAIEKFKGKYRNQCDVLLLEDVHYLGGKERTQIELALTLDALCEAGKRIIFSSCYLPSDIPKLNDKLRSRLACGLISTIDPPNFRTRVRILLRKALINGYKIPHNVIQFLAGELTEDVRQLESGLNGVMAKSSLMGVPIDLGLAESVIKNIVRHRKSITIKRIKKLVCKYYKVRLEDLMSRSRKQNLVRPRQMAIYLARQYTDSPLQTIGREFNRYHATALYAINCIERGMREDSAVKRQVEFFRQKLEGNHK